MFIFLVSFKKFSAVTSSYSFSAPLSSFQGLKQHKCWIFCYSSTCLQGSAHFSPSLISLCCSDWIISTVVSSSSLILSFVLPILLLSPSVKIFISITVFFSSKFPFGSSLYLLFLCRGF